MTKPLHDTLALADQVAGLLKRAGFELRYVSMKSEACYYGWPGNAAVIRVATHQQKASHFNINGATVLAKITLRGTHLIRRGQMAMAENKVLSVVATAIGTYFLRSAGVRSW